MRNKRSASLSLLAALSIAAAFGQEAPEGPPLLSNELPRWSAGAHAGLAVGGDGFEAVPGLSGSYGDLQAGLHFGLADGVAQAAATADLLLLNEPLLGSPISWFVGPGVYLAAGSDFKDFFEYGAGLRAVGGVRSLIAGRFEAFAALVPSYGMSLSGDLQEPSWSLGAELGLRYAIPRKQGLTLEASRPEGDWTPDGDGLNDRLELKAVAGGEYGIRSWKLEVFNPAGQPFYTKEVKGPLPPAIEWDGVGEGGDKVASMLTYKYSLSAVDKMGAGATFKDGIIPVGIVLRRSGEDFLLDLTGFVFAPDSPKLATDAAAAKENARLLASLKACLDRLGQYRLTIVGHAVNLSGTEKEEASLVGLSTARAETVKAELKKLGYDVSEVSTVGKGGTQPVVPHSDAANRWKNRRVEFIMTPKGAVK